MVRTFQEHQNAMIKNLRDHVESLSNQKAATEKQLIDALTLIHKIALITKNPEIQDAEVLRIAINTEIIDYLDKLKRQD